MQPKEVDFGVPVDDSLNTVCYSNDEGFARIIKLYARDGDTIVDPTYGNGVFWKQIDKSKYNVLATDLKTDNINLIDLPYKNDSIDLIVIDIPYRYFPVKSKKQDDIEGHGKVSDLYNLKDSSLKNNQAVLNLYHKGMIEAKRILKKGGFLVIKCQDTVQDGKNIWNHTILMQEAEKLDFACRDLLIIVTKSPTKTRWDKQRHLRKAHSYFLVFRKNGHFPFGIPSVCEK